MSSSGSIVIDRRSFEGGALNVVGRRDIDQSDLIGSHKMESDLIILAVGRRQGTVNVPKLLLERIERAMERGWTGVLSRDEFARQCIEARLEALERLQLDSGMMRSDLSSSKPRSNR